MTNQQVPPPMVDWLHEQGHKRLANLLAHPRGLELATLLLEDINTSARGVEFNVIGNQLECFCTGSGHDAECLIGIIGCIVDPAFCARETERAWDAAIVSEKRRKQYREKKRRAAQE